jgi:hypothetical protein
VKGARSLNLRHHPIRFKSYSRVLHIIRSCTSPGVRPYIHVYPSTLYMLGLSTGLCLSSSSFPFTSKLSYYFYIINKYVRYNNLHSFYKMAWVRARLTKRVHLTRSRKWWSLLVGCPWSVVLSGYSGFLHHYSWNIVESGAKTPEIKNQIILFSKISIYNLLSVIHFPFDLTELKYQKSSPSNHSFYIYNSLSVIHFSFHLTKKYFQCKRTWHDIWMTDMRVTNWPNIFVDQSQFSDPDFINGTHQRENVQFANNEICRSVWCQTHYMTLPLKTIPSVIKVSTYIITSIKALPVGLAALLTIMSVLTVTITVIL